MKMPDTPRLIFWELTKRCNLACQHCRAEADDTIYQGEMDTQEALKVIDDITKDYKPILVLTGGEPLYREDIYQIARYAGEKGCRPALATNGTLIDRDVAVKIKESGIERVSISLDGASPDIHDTIRGIKGAFDQARAGARHLKDVGVDFQINTTITRSNAHSVEEIHQMAVDEGAVALHLFMLVPVGCGIEIVESEMLSSEKYEELLHWFYDKTQESGIEFRATCAPHYYRIIRQRAKEEGRKLTFETDGMAAVTRGCLAGSGVCFISHRGDVQPCGYLPLVAGNVREQPFKKIWEESELFLSLRDPNLLEGKCGICEYRMVCGGCRARAYHETGDHLAEEPFCTYEPAGSK